jgi:hypothetical protein
VAIIGSWHFNQAGHSNVMQMVNGSSGMPAVSINRLCIVREHDQPEGRLVSHSKRGAQADWLLQFDPVTCQWVRLGDTKQHRLSEARQRVVEHLDEVGEAHIRELCDTTEAPYNNMVQLLKSMREDGLVEQAGKRGVYRLPLAAPEPSHDRSTIPMIENDPPMIETQRSDHGTLPTVMQQKAFHDSMIAISPLSEDDSPPDHEDHGIMERDTPHSDAGMFHDRPIMKDDHGDHGRDHEPDSHDHAAANGIKMAPADVKSIPHRTNVNERRRRDT